MIAGILHRLGRRSPPVVTFGIPLKGSTDPDEWAQICRLLSATVASIYNQTDPAFKIVIACDRKPDLDLLTDRRLELLKVRPFTPATHDDGDSDAGYKRWEIACRFVSSGGGYLMFVDADDLVSNRLVSFVRETQHPTGYVFETGYGMNARNGMFLPIPQPGITDTVFHKMCGSCAVVRLSSEDMAASDGETPRFHRLYRLGHTTVAETSEQEGRPMMTMPFRAAVYVIGTKVSQSAIRAQEQPDFGAGRESWLERFGKQGFRNPEIEKEFGLAYRRSGWANGFGALGLLRWLAAFGRAPPRHAR